MECKQGAHNALDRPSGSQVADLARGSDCRSDRQQRRRSLRGQVQALQEFGPRAYRYGRPCRKPVRASRNAGPQVTCRNALAPSMTNKRQRSAHRPGRTGNARRTRRTAASPRGGQHAWSGSQTAQRAQQGRGTSWRTASWPTRRSAASGVGQHKGRRRPADRSPDRRNATGRQAARGVRQGVPPRTVVRRRQPIRARTSSRPVGRRLVAGDRELAGRGRATPDQDEDEPHDSLLPPRGLLALPAAGRAEPVLERTAAEPGPLVHARQRGQGEE